MLGKMVCNCFVYCVANCAWALSWLQDKVKLVRSSKKHICGDGGAWTEASPSKLLEAMQ